MWEITESGVGRTGTADMSWARRAASTSSLLASLLLSPQATWDWTQTLLPDPVTPRLRLSLEMYLGQDSGIAG